MAETKKEIKYEDFPIKVPVEVAVSFDTDTALKCAADALVESLLTRLQSQLLKKAPPWAVVDKAMPEIAIWRKKHPSIVLSYDMVDRTIKLKSL